MVLLDYTLHLNNIGIEAIVGAVIAVVIGRAMRGGFGVFGDIVLGIVGAVVLAFIVSYWGLFNVDEKGLPSVIVVALIGGIVLTALVHLFSNRRTTAAA